jgi:hypothetical protein
MLGRQARPCESFLVCIEDRRCGSRDDFPSHFLCYFRARLDSRFLGGFGSDLFGGFFHECLVPLFPVISCPKLLKSS